LAEGKPGRNLVSPERRAPGGDKDQRLADRDPVGEDALDHILGRVEGAHGLALSEEGEGITWRGRLVGFLLPPALPPLGGPGKDRVLERKARERLQDVGRVRAQVVIQPHLAVP